MVSAGDSFPARCAATIAATVSVTQDSASEGGLALPWRTMLPAYKSSCNRSKGCAMCTPSGAPRDIKIDIYYQMFERGSRVRSMAADAPVPTQSAHFQGRLRRAALLAPARGQAARG